MHVQCLVVLELPGQADDIASRQAATPARTCAVIGGVVCLTCVCHAVQALAAGQAALAQRTQEALEHSGLSELDLGKRPHIQLPASGRAASSADIVLRS